MTPLLSSTDATRQLLIDSPTESAQGALVIRSKKQPRSKTHDPNLIPPIHHHAIVHQEGSETGLAMTFEPARSTRTRN